MAEDMSDKAGHRQLHLTAWCLVVAVLYVLSAAPVRCLNYIGGHAAIPVPWVDAFYKPVTWLYNETPLNGPLAAWDAFWFVTFK